MTGNEAVLAHRDEGVRIPLIFGDGRVQQLFRQPKVRGFGRKGGADNRKASALNECFRVECESFFSWVRNVFNNPIAINEFVSHPARFKSNHAHRGQRRQRRFGKDVSLLLVESNLFCCDRFKMLAQKITLEFRQRQCSAVKVLRVINRHRNAEPTEQILSAVNRQTTHLGALLFAEHPLVKVVGKYRVSKFREFHGVQLS